MRTLVFLFVLVSSHAASSEVITQNDDLGVTRTNEYGRQVTMIVPMPWSFDCRFPRKSRGDVRAGFEYWNVMAGKKVFVERPCGTTSPRVGISVEFETGLYNDRDQTLATFAARRLRVGETDRIVGGQMKFYSTWFDESRQWVRVLTAEHEAGHSLGFQHVLPPECLMHPHIDSVGAPKGMCRRELQVFLERYGQ